MTAFAYKGGVLSRLHVRAVWVVHFAELFGLAMAAPSNKGVRAAWVGDRPCSDECPGNRRMGQA